MRETRAEIHAIRHARRRLAGMLQLAVFPDEAQGIKEANDKKANPRSLTMDDFRQILEERKPSVSLDMLSLYNRWSEAFKAL